MLFTQEQFREEIKRWENQLRDECKKCGGTGAISVPGEVSKMCTCMQTAILNANLVSCGIPRKYLDSKWSWETCTQQAFVKKCKNYSDNFIDSYKNGKGVYLFGSQGRGKSTMEALIAKDAALKINPYTKKHFKVAFIIYEEMIQLSHQKNINYNAANKYEALINIPDLLIIDNIGSETGLGSETGHTAKTLDLILRKRDAARVPTILSSNFTPEELKKNYSNSVYEFVSQNCEMISVTGDNFRIKASETSNLLDEWED